jgi:hypothetical protein
MTVFDKAASRLVTQSFVGTCDKRHGHVSSSS